jgi:hypothetical protein
MANAESLAELPLRAETRARLEAAALLDVDAIVAVFSWNAERTCAALALDPTERAALTRLPAPKQGGPILGARGLDVSALAAAKSPPWAPGDDLLSLSLPSSASLVEVARALGVRDQGARGTCVAFAAATAAAINRREPATLSPEYLYWEMKRREGFPASDGSYAQVALHILEDQGLCLEALHPYDPRPRQAGLPYEGQEPGPAATKDAKNRRLGPGLLASRIDKIAQTVQPWWDIWGARALDADARRDGPLQLSRAALAGAMGVPPRAVIGCFAVFSSSFAAAQASGTLSLPLPDEEDEGGHAMTLIGYEDNPKAPGGGWLFVQNSWGPRWPVRTPIAPGCFRMPYAYAARHQWEAGVVLLPGEIDKLRVQRPGRYHEAPPALRSDAAACAACGALRAADARFCTHCGAAQTAPPVDRVAAMKARHEERLSAVRSRLEPATAPRSQCMFCRSSAFGPCITSPERVHKHNVDGRHCAYCGSAAYGACITAPHRKHEHGTGNGCRFCGSRSTGSCLSSPHGVHVH